MKTALVISVLWIASLAYLSMATGVVGVATARHIDWLATTPLLLLDLGMMSNAPGHEITLAVVADVLMVVAGYMAVAFPQHRTLFWSAGMLFFGPVVYLLWKWHQTVTPDKKPALQATLVLWTVYPALFFMDESHVATQWAYAAVDVAAKAGVGAMIAYSP